MVKFTETLRAKLYKNRVHGKLWKDNVMTNYIKIELAKQLSTKNSIRI